MLSRSLAMAVVVAIFMMSQIVPVSSHGRLWSPPGRATMWRVGFQTPINFNDNQLFCGGLQHQQEQGYKCGLCGDPYDDKKRPNEAGGEFATGKISANYTQGQEVVLKVDLTANHKGWFEFKICPTNDPKVKATQECLDLYPLQLSDGSGTKLNVANYGTRMISIPVRLPVNLSCDLCMLQWHYHGGNNWGTEPDGHGCIGCGYTNQEEFYGCADIRIKPSTDTKQKTDLSKRGTIASPLEGITSTPKTNDLKHPEKLGSHQGGVNVNSDIFKMTSRVPVMVKAIDGTNTPAQTTITSLWRSGGDLNDNSQQILPTTSFPFVPPHADKPKSFQNMNPHSTLTCQALSDVPVLTEWCYHNCMAGNCPQTHCKCQFAQSALTGPSIDTDLSQQTTHLPQQLPNLPKQPRTYSQLKNGLNEASSPFIKSLQKPRTTSDPGSFIPPHADKPKSFQNMNPHSTLTCQALSDVPGLTEWCYHNCMAGNCPQTHCKCQFAQSALAGPSIDTDLSQQTTHLPQQLPNLPRQPPTYSQLKNGLNEASSPFIKSLQKPRTTSDPGSFIPPHADKPKSFQNMNPHSTLTCQALSVVPGLTEWCYHNCMAGNCPQTHCKCQFAQSALTGLSIDTKMPQQATQVPQQLPNLSQDKNGVNKAFSPFIKSLQKLRTTSDPGSFIPPHPDKPKSFQNLNAHSTLKCQALSDVPGLTEWCYHNCIAGYCPSSDCKCDFASNP